MSATMDTMAPPEAGSSMDESQMQEFLGFVLGDERYALPLSSIREILRVPVVTEVPRGPQDVLGIVSVRGQVTTLIDLRRRLRMPERPLDSRCRVLLVERGNEVIGLLVDRVLQVYRMREDEMELASVLGSETSSHVMGVGRPGSKSSSGDADYGDAPDESRGDGEIVVLIDPMTLLKPYGAS